VLLVREPEGGVALVEPKDSELESATGVEAGGAGVGEREGLSAGGGFKEVGPFGAEEGEIAHTC